jgi:hypothetical protein
MLWHFLDGTDKLSAAKQQTATVNHQQQHLQHFSSINTIDAVHATGSGSCSPGRPLAVHTAAAWPAALYTFLQLQ